MNKKRKTKKDKDYDKVFNDIVGIISLYREKNSILSNSSIDDPRVHEIVNKVSKIANETGCQDTISIINQALDTIIYVKEALDLGEIMLRYPNGTETEIIRKYKKETLKPKQI